MFSKTALFALIPTGMALAAGALLPFQAAANAASARALGHPLWGALTSLTVSALVVLITSLVLKTPAPTIGNAFHGPWWLWIGGVQGAVYVGGAAAVTPRLGAGGFLVCVVAGQILAAMLVDHFGLMGLATKPINLTRLAGVVLILGGVLLVLQGAATSSPSNTAIRAAR